MTDETRVVSASRVVHAAAETIFELIADPARQPEWDGNDNLSQAAPGQRVHAVGDAFLMTNTNGNVRQNHVVEFAEGRLIAWKPAPVDGPVPGHVWRWELAPLDDGTTRLTHTYDWSGLTDERRVKRARSTTAEKLQASVDRLAALVEG
ncbi:Activator of Hsp90 ATPase 1 family protein [Xylanimonas cellulosilytica DSM 15894]|uniref:Activator of Hsp90 ATPase 1 family protein n=1 Tax=Xylanimonas cellulosilytica (strain DSM 15894 / JCM 12276 / CECT 5975 / KCTC 9989 / LMG 20990 / NBRC 107835 / XIL07) TaxID=446471 RepID=D1BSU8_XYLCX|nr:SRPBCC family protein [Xylanimonas cellulosilytica]ACZ30790.1 Activator of Hsp90 ATPase 1 family protein [Xylanimonas cellulosilytica DSM 15894]